MKPVSLPLGYEIRAARPEEMPHTVRFIESVMRAPREHFIARYRSYPNALPEHSRLVVHDGQIVAHQRLYHHPIGFSGTVINAWAVGDVCTHPAHRRKGLGRALLEDCVRYIREQGGALCLIRSSVFYFYCSIGWDSIAVPAFRLDVEKFPSESLRTDGYETRTFEESLDLWRVASVHQQFNAGRDLVRQRDGYFWANHRTWRLGDTNGGFVVAEKDGEIGAYGRMVGNRITELCHLPGEESAVNAVLEALVRRARSQRLNEIVGALPRDHLLWNVLRNAAGVDTTEDNHTLLRLVDLKLLFSQILDSLSARLRASGRELSGPITFRCADQEVTLVPHSGYLSLVDNISDARQVNLPQRHLLELGAGLASPSAILKGIADEDTLADLEALFPLGHPIYWESDTV